MNEHQQFWTWFMRHVCEVNRVMIANIGTFTLCYKNEQFYIRFKPTGYFGGVYVNKMNQREIKNRIFGEEFAVQNALIWGPIVAKKQSLKKVSQQRRLMWYYAEHQNIQVTDSARIVSSALQELCSKLLNERRIDLTEHWTIQCRDASPYFYTNNRYVYSRIGHNHLVDVMSQMGIE